MIARGRPVKKRGKLVLTPILGANKSELLSLIKNRFSVEVFTFDTAYAFLGRKFPGFAGTKGETLNEVLTDPAFANEGRYYWLAECNKDDPEWGIMVGSKTYFPERRFYAEYKGDCLKVEQRRIRKAKSYGGL